MIVSFSVSNFRSFATEETFNLVASNRFSDSHVNHAVPIPGSDDKVLKTGVLYGANGAGKSNLFKAMKYLCRRALKAQERSAGTGREAFRFANMSDAPSVFDLRFVAKNQLYGFGFAADDNRILEEWLVRIDGAKETPLYERATNKGGKVTVEAPGLTNVRKKLDALVTVGAPPNQTFLATVRATLDSEDIGAELSGVIGWFEDSLVLVGPSASPVGLGTRLGQDSEFLEFASSFLRNSATGVQNLEVNKKELKEDELRALLPGDVVERVLRDTKRESALVELASGEELVIERGDHDHYYLLTIAAQHEHKSGSRVTMELSEESDGTQRLLNLIPALRHLQTEDVTYFIDEIDRSMHPMLVWKFLEFFLKSCGTGHCQIIVTTHESNLLDLDLLRRDEIWFAEKDPQGATRLYSLSDFKVRKDLEIRKHYLRGRFGAIPFLGNLDRLLPKP